MNPATPYVYINDDEIELKKIVILYGNAKKQRKFTISEAEKRGLINVDSGPHRFSDDEFSKSISIMDNRVRLCLSTK